MSSVTCEARACMLAAVSRAVLWVHATGAGRTRWWSSGSMSVQLTITSIVCAGVMHGGAIGGVRRRGGINTLRAPGAGVDV
eukprot:scaffold13627_cov103-Phaeocystis_antarctica.AAC.1